jgi:hypothetical protein
MFNSNSTNAQWIDRYRDFSLRLNKLMYFSFFLDDNSRCRSSPPPPPAIVQSLASNRYLACERKSFTEEDFRQLLQDNHNPSRSLSTTNEETTSSFSGWDDIPASPLPSIKSNHGHIQQQEFVKPIPSAIVDCYYPRRPCDLSFTVNMTTTEDDSSSRTDTKSTVIASPTSTVVTITSPPQQVHIVKPTVVSSQPPPPPPQQTQISRYRPAPFNLARKLIADTSESALSEISVEQQHEPWTRNIAYQSIYPQRTRLSSSYNNLHDLVQINDSLR